VRERKWHFRETLSRGVCGGIQITPLHTNGKEKRTTIKIKGQHSSFNAVLPWKMEVFYNIIS